MQFDPTFNYGDIDLTNEESLMLWRFGELIKTLITLSSNAERQVELIGYGAVADEMAEDFHSYFTITYESYTAAGLVDEVTLNKLKQLDSFLEQRSGNKDPDFWDDYKLGTNNDWELVRLKAKEILKLLSMDDLDIEFDRKEKYEMTAKGKQLLIQSTRTRLVRHTGS